jgi:hypothetical protein
VSTPDTPGPVEELGPKRHGRRFVIAGVAVALLAGAVVAADRTNVFGATGEPEPAPTNSEQNKGNGTSLATVAKQTLSAQTTVDGRLGYADSYPVLGSLNGTVTWLPEEGRVFERGHVLYRVDGEPVILMYGTMPAYRDLAAGDDSDDVSGQDVKQLNENLVALGYGEDEELDPESDEYSWRTREAVEDLQDDLGIDDTGKVARGQIIFLPGPIRVTDVKATLGGQAGGTVMEASSSTRLVTVALDTAQQSQLKVGDPVTITLPSGETTPGKVSYVGKVASTPQSEDEAPTIDVEITPTDPKATGSLDQAPVEVNITTAQAEDATVVPVEALLALAGGGYAVERVSAAGEHKLIRVSLGLFDDTESKVQVTDTELKPGDRVVVPST